MWAHACMPYAIWVHRWHLVTPTGLAHCANTLQHLYNMLRDGLKAIGHRGKRLQGCLGVIKAWCMAIPEFWPKGQVSRVISGEPDLVPSDDVAPRCCTRHQLSTHQVLDSNHMVYHI